MIGRTLAHYEVLSLVGKGGMGEVYRARDTKLDREVALKVLPREMSGDPERAARFDREARTLASLNHPNIAQIFGIEEVEGVRFLAMEFVEGEDLAQRLARGPVDVEEAIRIAAAVADGLEAAHHRGVVHRDLKPANVKVTPEGVVKVLDFGLARAYAGEDVSESDPALSPTITQAMTVAGTILGTAAYMSPEQARGRRVDKRADLWAFGVLLYEMLCGRRLFDGGSTTDTLAAVLREDIDFDRLPAGTPPRVRRVLRRCLERDLDARQRDAGDVRLDLLEREETAVVSAGRPWLAPVGLLLGLLVGAAAVWLAKTPSPVADSSPSWRAVTVDGPYFVDPASLNLRADGRQLVYSQRNVEGTLMLLDLDGRTARPIPGSEGGFSPAYSPSGEEIVYGTDEGVFRSRLDGGARRRLTPRSEMIMRFLWSETDTIYFSALSLNGSNNMGILAIPAEGGEVRTVSRTDPSGPYSGHLINDLLPDQRHALVVLFGAGARRLDLGVVDLWTGTTKKIDDTAGIPRWSPTGHLVLADLRRDALVAVPFSSDDLEFTGPPQEIFQGLDILDPSGFGFSLSREGTLVWGKALVGSIDEEKRELVRLTPEGAQRIESIPLGPWSEPDLAPDGRTLVLRQGSAQDCSLWTFDLQTGTSARISLDGDNHQPLWLPDGRLAYVEQKGAHRALEILDRVPGPTRTLFEAEDASFDLSDCTRDGRWLFVEDVAVGNDERGIYLVSVDEPGETRPWLVREPEDREAALRPDGEWVAHSSREQGRSEVFLRRFDDVQTAVQVSTNGGTRPRWSVDGNTLYFEEGTKLMACDVVTEGGPKLTPPRVVLDDHRSEFEVGNYLDTPQGLLLVRGDPSLERVQNVTVLFGLADRIAQSQ